MAALNHVASLKVELAEPIRMMRSRVVRACLSGFVSLSLASSVRAVSVDNYHNDTSSSGVNASETNLTPANVNATNFGKLFSTYVDGLIQAQPLFVPGVVVTNGPNAGTHDLVFVATQHDSLYAIDANTGAVVWHTSFLDSGLAGATITTVPSADTKSTDITPEVGICSTPVIDPSTNMLYVTAKTKQVIGGGTPNYLYTLYKIDITNGNPTQDANIVASTVIGDTTFDGTNYGFRTASSPTAAQDPFTANATGEGAITVNGQSRVYFNALREMNRPGLTIYGGVVYIAFGSHGDNSPYHGWILGYAESNLAITAALNVSPNGGQCGIWESGAAPTVDSSGNIYVVTGNGTFDGANGYVSGSSAPGPVTGLNGSNLPSHGDYGDCVLRIEVDNTTSPGSQGVNGWGLKVTDYFSPYNNLQLTNDDSDLGSGGCLLLPDSAGSTPHPHLMVAAGKLGTLYLIDRDNMGKFSTTNNDVQSVSVYNGSFSTPAFFNGTLYWNLVSSPLQAFGISNGVMSSNPSQSSVYYGWPGAVASISANGTSNGIVWSIDYSASAVYAYNASNITSILWSSTDHASRDSLGTPTKFTALAVANGKVMAATSNALVVYGLLNSSGNAVSPTVATGTASAITPTSATLAGTVNPEGSDTTVYFQYGTTTTYTSSSATSDAGSGSSSAGFTGTLSGLLPSTPYHYRAVASSTGGTAYGADKTFKTPPQQHIAGTPQVDLSASGAQIAYSIATDDLPTTVYIQYGTSTSYGSVTPTIKLGPSLATANLFAFLSGLEPGTTYDYQIVTQSADGTVVGSNQTFTTLDASPDLVAAKGTANPAAAGTTFASFGNPAVNDSGYSAFRGVLATGSGVTAANAGGIWSDNTNGDLQLVAQANSGAAQGTSAPFAAFDDPVYNASEAVAFIGTLKVGTGLASAANDLGVWSTTTGALSLVAQKGTQAPGYASGATFAGFTQIVLPDVNGVIILGTVNANRALGISAANNTGIWEANGSNNLSLLVHTGQVINGKTLTALSLFTPPAPVTGQGRSFSPATGSVTFLATFSDRTTGIFDVTSSGTITSVAVTGGSAPVGPTGATFASFGPPAINSQGRNAFRAILATSAAAGISAANNVALYAPGGSNALEPIAETGTGDAPGTTAPFTAFDDPVFNDNNQVAFVGTLKVGTGLATAANKLGVWSNSGGTLALIAQSGVQAPGCPAGVKFSAFSQIALPTQYGVAMLATLGLNAPLGVSPATDLGIWATDNNGNLDLIVRTGEVINGKTVSSLAFLPAVATVQGQSRSVSPGAGNLTYLVTFSDRTTAIYSVVFP